MSAYRSTPTARTAGVDSRVVLDPSGGSGLRLHRQPDLEAGVAGSRDEPDVPAVSADDDPVAYVQTETCTLAYILGGEERLEDATLDLLGDAGPVVRDLDQQSIAFLCRAELYAAGLIPVGHGIYGVVYQVRPDLVEFAPVGGNAGQPLLIVALDLDAR